MAGALNDGFRSRSTSNNTAPSGCWSRPSRSSVSRYQLPALPGDGLATGRCGSFSGTKEKGGRRHPFIHAHESETSLSLYLTPEMVDMTKAVDRRGSSSCRAPLRHLGGHVHAAAPLERGRGPLRHRDKGHPGGVVGKATTPPLRRPSGPWWRSCAISPWCRMRSWRPSRRQAAPRGDDDAAATRRSWPPTS